LIGDNPLCCIKHSITRYRITLEAWGAKLSTGKSPAANSALPGQWRTLRQLHRLAFTSAHKKILGRLESGAEVTRAADASRQPTSP
jgi:hypothetical protein